MLLTVKDVTKDFGGLRALDKVNMTLEEGKITALIGPNGAGKTTLFNIIVGVYPATEGSVFFGEKRIDGLPTYKRVEEGIARTFQLAKLFRKMTVLENVMVGRHTRATAGTLLPVVLNLPHVRHEEVKIHEYAMEMLKLAGIEKHANELAGNLPHGQQRLLEMARCWRDAVPRRSDLELTDKSVGSAGSRIFVRCSRAWTCLRPPPNGKTVRGCCLRAFNQFRIIGEICCVRAIKFPDQRLS